MYQINVNSDLLLIVVATALALIFDWFPPAAKWFDGLEEGTKRLVNAGLLLLVSVAIFAGICAGVFSAGLACAAKGALDLLVIWFTAVTVNQGIHFGLKPSAAAKARMFS
jgi:hypothetical protein